MSLRKLMVVGLLVLLFAVASLVFFVLWSGRGMLESPHTKTETDTEWLTVANNSFEFRGTVYSTTEALLKGLLKLQSTTKLVSVRWVAAGEASLPSEVQFAQVQQARVALREAHIATPTAVIGNEVFTAKPSDEPSTR